MGGREGVFMRHTKSLDQLRDELQEWCITNGVFFTAANESGDADVMLSCFCEGGAIGSIKVNEDEER